MAERKPLFMGSMGFSEEMATTDDLTLGKLTIDSGGTGIVMNGKKVTGMGDATTAGDALAYGQSGASLGDLTIASGGDINLSGGGEVLGLPATPSTSGAAASKAYIDAQVIAGGHVKELVLHEEQLDDAEGIFSAIALTIQANPVDADTIIITDGTTTRTYYFGTGSGDVQVTIGGTIAATMQNLATAITGDGSGAWNAYFTTDLDAIDPDGVVAIMERDTAQAASKIHGVWGTQSNCAVVDYYGEAEYSKKTLSTLPSSLPTNTNFGFHRTQANLSAGEIHYVENNDTAYSWDDDGNVWVTMTGPYSIPDATSASGGGTKGKVTFDSDYGLVVSTGIAKINLGTTNPTLYFGGSDPKYLEVKQSDGLTQDTNGLKVALDGSGSGLEFTGTAGDGTLGIKLEASNPSLQVDGSNQLGVKLDAAGAIVSGASGVKVNLETTNPTLKIASNELGVKFDTAQGLKTGATGLAVNVETDGAVVFDGVNGGLEIKLETTNPSLQISSNELGVKLGDGITKDTNGVLVDLYPTNPGLELVGSSPNKQLDVKAGDGITKDTYGVTIDLATTPGLQLTGSSPNKELSVLPDGTKGIEVGAGGVAVKLEADAAIVFDGTNGGLEINLETTNPTLAIVSNELGVKYGATTSGLTKDAAGLKVSVDGTTIQINGSGQLYTAGTSEAERIENDFTIKGGETVAAGDPVNWSSTADQVEESRADTDSKAWVIGVTKAVVSTTATVVSLGTCTGVLSGATPGTPYYLGDTGGLSTSLPSAAKRVIQCGLAKNTTDLWVRIVDFGKKAA